MLQEISQALHNGKSEAKATILFARTIVELIVLVENRLKFVAGNTDPGVPDFDAQDTRASSATEQDPAALGVLQSIRKQIADHLLQQMRIAADRQAATDDAQDKPLRLCMISELITQPVEQIVDREIHDIGMDGAGLDLVDVQERVQHARHDAQCPVKPCDQPLRFLPLDSLCEHALEQAQRLQRLPQVMARGSEKTRLGDGRQLRPALGFLKYVRGASAFGAVGKGDDDALHSVTLGAVRQDAANVPGTAPRLDFPLDRCESLQHRLSIGEKNTVVRKRVKIRKRPSNVAGNDAEQRSGGWGEKADIEPGIKERRGDIGAIQDVLQIVGCRALSLQSFLELAVEGG